MCTSQDINHQFGSFVTLRDLFTRDLLVSPPDLDLLFNFHEVEPIPGDLGAFPPARKTEFYSVRFCYVPEKEFELVRITIGPIVILDEEDEEENFFGNVHLPSNDAVGCVLLLVSQTCAA
ncbi:hypothetical protein RUM44_006639 [Polyplax serrata]|uniref:Uncharacterized protein n=1 Tax=Polyplax serrata TaxID=468196 RepID=A0ABR1AIQ7_POLSC